MDEDLHAKLRRPVANAYAMSTLVGYEPLIDSTFNLFLEKMQQRFVETGVECDLATWLQMYAFDTMLVYATTQLCKLLTPIAQRLLSVPSSASLSPAKTSVT